MTDPRLERLLEELARPVPAPPDRRKEQLQTVLRLIAAALKDETSVASRRSPGYV